jgi:hypothetical protein
VFGFDRGKARQGGIVEQGIGWHAHKLARGNGKIKPHTRISR